MKDIATKQHVALVELIRTERRKGNLRQIDVAKKIGKNQQWVAHVETGQRRISVVEFIALAETIGFDPAKAIKKISKIKNS